MSRIHLSVDFFVILCLALLSLFFFFFNDTATTEIYTLSLHDALPISPQRFRSYQDVRRDTIALASEKSARASKTCLHFIGDEQDTVATANPLQDRKELRRRDRKSVV